MLWTVFKLDTRRRASVPVNKLEEYLCRSGTLLLELYFKISCCDFEECDKDHIELFTQNFALVETAAAHAYRWRRFTLLADPIFEVTRCLEKIHTPNLEYLAMC